jgi:hypothetical protein
MPSNVSIMSISIEQFVISVAEAVPEARERLLECLADVDDGLVVYNAAGDLGTFARALHADGSHVAIEQLKRVMKIAEDATTDGVPQVSDSIGLDFLPAMAVIPQDILRYMGANTLKEVFAGKHRIDSE